MQYTKKDEEIVKKLRKENTQFRDDEKVHERLSKQLEKLNKRKNLLPDEEVSAKKIHVEKLALKDHLMEMIRQFKLNKMKV
ncbi:MAG: DUF465 domain-containing protein [Nitrospirae bacterium]|nr:DUF465 domain-containing protein [Nitrospirota bacterium]MBI3593947.1 DUF465 domain-containing protein [Nitrospirota bacterium]